MAGIYIHVPFCRSFCKYCDFYSVRGLQERAPYLSALYREIEARRNFFTEDSSSAVHLTTVYFGGGTPSQLQVSDISDILRHLSGTFFADTPLGAAAAEEITVEVNPDDVTPEYASALHGCGVNRVSMGVQSFDDGCLRWMNRRHNSAGASAAFRTLRGAGFSNLSIDLIFGYIPASLPAMGEEEMMERWREDLLCAIAAGPEHISAYQMTVEPGSALGEMAAAGAYTEPSQEFCAAQYELLQKMLSEVGYCQYEVSNFSKPGFHSRHNSSYWEREPYLGLGPAAHSFRGTRRSWNPADIAAYAGMYSEAAAADGCRKGDECPVADGFAAEDLYENLTPENIMDETVMLGLRKVAGFSLTEMDEQFRAGVSARAKELAERGLLIMEGDTVRIPCSKMFISEYIIGELIADRPDQPASR